MNHTELYQRGRAAMEQGDFPLAVELFQQSVDLFPHFKTLELLGECWLKLGQPTRAVVVLGAASTLGHRASRALYLLARTLNKIGERDKAIEKLREAITIQPDYESAKRLLESLNENEESVTSASEN